MLKITPKLNNNFVKTLSTNKKSFLLSSIITATILSAVATNGCSKNLPIIEDKFEKQDSTKTEEKDNNLGVVIDSSYNVIHHEIIL